MEEAQLSRKFLPNPEQKYLAELAARECALARLETFGPWSRAKQRRAVAIYDCLAAGWPRPWLAKVCGVHQNSLMPWALRAEELGQLERYRIRREIRAGA